MQVGLDPGMDHMMIMKAVDHIHSRGGVVKVCYHNKCIIYDNISPRNLFPFAEVYQIPWLLIILCGISSLGRQKEF